MKVNQFSLKEQADQLAPELIQAAKRVIESGSYILGQEGKSFEDAVKCKLGVGYAIGVANGTDALYLSLRALGIGPGDYVVTTPFTFMGTVSAICLTGAKPLFVDIFERTYNLSAVKLSDFLERPTVPRDKIKAVLPVHLYGQASEMIEITRIANKFNLPVLEDCAQAWGTQYHERFVGSFGDVAGFSFFPTKNLGALGDAGVVVTSSEEIYQRILSLRNHGSSIRYYHDYIGVNSRLDELQAAFLNLKLKYIDGWLDRRKSIAAQYDDYFATCPELQTPLIGEGCTHTYHQYVIQVPSSHRDQILGRIQKRGVGAGVYYPLSLHEQKSLMSLGYQKGDFPTSERIASQVIALPMFPELSDDEVHFVAKATLAVVQQVM